MIKIERLRLKNFKSFRKANIPFAEGFTAIAGPNASGKSNILDSMLFVFGITSLKMLRVGKLTELVNHDSVEGIAKAEIDLRNSNRTFTISRTIDKQGKSVFRLDGKRKGLNEITALLLELGVKATGHNIVAQGDINRIIEMNPKQRRGIIEDIAGLQEFEEKKDEAMKKLEKVDRRIKDTNLVLNERGRYLEELENEKEAALKYQKLTEALKRHKAAILAEEIKKIRAELSGAKRKIEAMEREIKRREKEKQQLAEQEKREEEKLDKITKKMIKASEETYSTIGRDVEKKRADIKILNERIYNKEGEITKIQQRIGNLNQRKKLEYEEAREKQEAIKRKQLDLREIEYTLEPFEKRAEEKARKIKELSGAMKAEEEKLRETANLINKDQKLFYELEAEASGINKEILLLGEEAEKIEKEKGDLKLKEKIAMLLSFEKKLGEVDGRLNGLNSELNTMKEEKKGLRNELEEVQKQIINLIEIEKRLLEEVKELRVSFGGLAEREKHLGYKEKIRLREKELEKKKVEKNNMLETARTLETKKHNLTEKINELRQAMDELTGVSAVEKIENLRKRKEGLKNELTVLQTEVKQYEKGKKGLGEEVKALEAELGDIRKGIDEEKENKKGLNAELLKKEAELYKATDAAKLREEEKQRIETKINNISEKKAVLEKQVDQKEKEINELNLSFSKNEVRIVDLEQEEQEFKGIKILEEGSLNELKSRIVEIENEIDSLGAINMKALASFDSYKKEVFTIREKANKLEEERLAVLEMIDKIEVRKLNIFMDCFNQISKKFSELYYSFFEGEGKLGFSNDENPLESGLLIEAKYKEHKLKGIDAMSGGEKSLTALAFLFAIQSFEAASFYIFDEADAALDKENSLKVARMIREISKQSQFISITHNDSIIKESDQLIGVALNKQKSSVIGLRLKENNLNKGASS